MSRKTSWVVGCIAVASVFALLVSPVQATLILGFKFADGSTNVVVPASGGTYTVNVVATDDNAAVTNLGITSAFWGALSTVLNSNLGNGTLDGDVTAAALNPNMTSGNGAAGDIGDVNSDGRNDAGPVVNANSSNKSGGGGSHPWWWVDGNPTAFFPNASSTLLGTFTVTIPAYSPNANSGSFLSFTPNVQASNAITNYDIWNEITSAGQTNRAGKFNTAAGNTFVNIGSAVSFDAVAVPEPATLVLLGLAGVGLISFCRPKRKN